MAPLMFWRRRSGIQGVVEAHFWSLTRYRIGRRLVSLDYAGNVIFYPAYRKKTWGGWAAVTLGATNTSYLTNDTSAANVLEDGYPLHWRASARLKAFISEERRVWKLKKEEAIARRAAEMVEEKEKEKEVAGTSTQTSKDNGEKTVENKKETPRAYDEDDEQNFRDSLTIKCTSPDFAQRHLRLSHVKTLLYKALYFYLWGIAVSLIVQAYLLFRGWLNPPAREGLKNIENHVLHIPKLLFSLCVHGFAWVAQKIEPLVNPLLDYLQKNFPQVNWSAASPTAIATRAHQLAGNDEAVQKMAVAEEAKAAAGRKVLDKANEERRMWWKRTFLAFFFLFSILCII